MKRERESGNNARADVKESTTATAYPVYDEPLTGARIRNMPKEEKLDRGLALDLRPLKMLETNVSSKRLK